MLFRSGVAMSYDVGCRIDRGLPSLDMALVAAGDDAGSFAMEYFDSTDLSGPPVHVEAARLSRIMWLGQPHESLNVGSYSVRLTGTFTPDVSGPWNLGLESAGRSVLRLDGAVVVDNSNPLPRSEEHTSELQSLYTISYAELGRASCRERVLYTV